MAVWGKEIRFKVLETWMSFVRLVKDWIINNSNVTSNLHVEMLLWFYILHGLIEISSHVNNCSKDLFWEVQFRISLLIACVELFTKKYQSMAQWKGLLCALTRCTCDVSGVFFGNFCLSQELSVVRDITQSSFLLVCNLVSSTWSVLFLYPRV